MCTNADDEYLNQVYGVDSNPVVYLEYGPYMNWGRWNHNPSRVESLARAIVKAGFCVKLRHVQTEGSWDSHGDVVLRNETGEKSFKYEKYQHNMYYRNSSQVIQKALADLGTPSSW